MDKGQIYTDKQLRELAKRLKIDYATLIKEMDARFGEFYKRVSDYQKEQEKKKNKTNLLKKAAIIMELQLLKPTNKEIRDIAKDITLFNQKELIKVGQTMDNIYNYNVLYQSEKIGKSSYYGEIIANQKDITTPTLNKQKDIAYNSKNIRRTLTNSLNNGDSVQNISKALARTMSQNRNNTIMRARTLATGTESRGRLDTLLYANEELGTNYKKQWDNSHDMKVRDAHANGMGVGGEIRKIDEKFSNGLKYPGEFGGAWSEIANCRCVIRSIKA